VYLKNEVKEGENIKLFNNYNWGGYLIYHIPEIKVFVDGRGPHWVSDTGYSAMEDYLKVIRGEMGGKLIFDRYNINTLLIGSYYENDKDDKKEKSFVSVLKSFFMKMKIYFYGNNDDEKDSLSLYENIKKSGQWEIVFKDDVATIWRLKK
jgi:hypothetical protein